MLEGRVGSMSVGGKIDIDGYRDHSSEDTNRCNVSSARGSDLMDLITGGF